MNSCLHPALGRAAAIAGQCLALTCLLGAGQRGPSPAASLFVPGNRVPLSEYKVKGTNSVVLHVDPEILGWISSNSGVVQVAVRRSTGQIVYANATGTNPAAGTVTLNSNLLMGDCVAVTTLLKQGLPIVTHWNASLNNGRGGQEAGATDAILTLDLDVPSGALKATGSYDNTDPDWDDPSDPGAGPYTFQSNVYALFDDGSGEHVDAAVPAYERYIGENYSLYRPTNLAAIWLSDVVRAATGFPLAHRNGTEAFDVGAPAGRKLADDLPVFQAVHAHIVDIPDQGPVGNEDSLCTYILPPGWTSQAAGNTYPLLFNSQYDVHGRGTFLWTTEGEVVEAFSEIVFTTLGELYNQSPPRRAVACFWNGGGAVGTFTMHASAYDNTAQLIADASVLLRVNPEQIVFTGGSRGGIAALEMGSNPYNHPYTAKFINAYAPAVRMGTSIQYSSPSYSGSHGASTVAVGWANAWQEGWGYPGTEMTGLEATMLNLFDTTVPSVIDSQLSIDSKPFRGTDPGGTGGLLREGTFVLVRYGTNDFFHSYEQIARYYDHLVRDGIQIQLDVFYRFGHMVPRDAFPSNTDLMNMVFDGDNPLATKINHFGRHPDDYNQYRELQTPLHVPLVCETALKVGTGQMHTWSFVGEPGGSFEMRALNMGPGWEPGDEPPTDPLVTLLTGTLTSTGPNATFGSASYLRDGAAEGWWWYEVLYSPDGDTNYETVLGKCVLANGECTEAYHGVAPPIKTEQQPLMQVVDFPTVGDRDKARTGGLAEDDQLP